VNACGYVWPYKVPTCDGTAVCTPSDDALSVAQDLLDAATGFRYGVCQVRWSPEPALCCPPQGRWWDIPQLCCRVPNVPLPANCLAIPNPVVSVDTVLVEGAEFTDYTTDGNVLCRNDGTAWPQDVTVVYHYGTVPPVAGQMALGLLACELDKSWCGDECALPSNVTSITRENVAITFDPAVSKFNIPTVDSWVASVVSKAPSSGAYWGVC